MDDYHFVTVDPQKAKRQRNPPSDIFKLMYRFAPVFLLAAALPFLMFFVVSPPELGLLTRADTDSQLRMWLEPATVVTEPGRTVDLRVMAAFDDDRKLIPQIKAQVTGDKGIEVLSSSVEYKTPFNGQVELGVVKVSAIGFEGGKVLIPQDLVEIRAFDEPLEIVTSPAEIVVRRP
ncbi:hypothetical protein A2801_02520 [Candidatus Woesebacteria bacterium RIFCSPHIGHO2_01_FULL_41_10]|uniref:Cohesin domain-containing protein n=1 Tax=Candidatus Woesebacteria bacterium RIFCSPHIGHO2_01_FULL_41_10 TaxID=1802500 RepID=A0A1F7YNX5_9BACT|nr:MAG: hypothetical protein A2801_02520 [Candidatus Woesebacteria bacterium RIFCSPHIGHO2_01_FULL_41_10]